MAYKQTGTSLTPSQVQTRNLIRNYMTVFFTSVIFLRIIDFLPDQIDLDICGLLLN